MTDPRTVLTEREYQVYELRELRKFSLRQIMSALDISISTVRTTIERYERKLRKAA
jgi:DNA-binding CsgD family transcriptional regulator